MNHFNGQREEPDHEPQERELTEEEWRELSRPRCKWSTCFEYPPQGEEYCEEHKKLEGED